MNQPEINKVHMNVPQLMSCLISAQTSVHIWGRATGKTQGPIPYFIKENVFSMPRSNGFILGKTYSQILTKTLPPVIAALKRFGLYEDVHYWIGKFPPKKYNIDKAFICPTKPDNYITFCNGSGIYLVSQDRSATAYGLSTQWGVIDEAKEIDYARYVEEVSLTMRDCAEHFGHLSNYLSLMICSDMPTKSKAKWLLEYKNKMDEREVEALVWLNIRLTEIFEEIELLSEYEEKKYDSEIRSIKDQMNELRKGLVFFSFASTLDNVHTLGMDVIKKYKRDLSDFVFNTSVLNKETLMLPINFYPHLDEDIHGYEATNYMYLDSIDIDYANPPERDCRWDSDIFEGPLHISCDYNNPINCVVTGQRDFSHISMLSSLYVLRPLLLTDCAQKWCNYYMYHKKVCDVVYYYYDHTAVAKNASSDISFADEWIAVLQRNGWTVIPVYLGHTSSHNSRYHFSANLMQGLDERLPKLKFNMSTAKSWLVSCQLCGVVRHGDEYKKDKRPEGDEQFPQEEAPHLSDAGDTLLRGLCQDEIQHNPIYLEMSI